MPTVLRASRWCVSTIVIVVIAVVAAAVAVVLRTAAASPAAAAASFFASLRGGFEELVGVSASRVEASASRYPGCSDPGCSDPADQNRAWCSPSDFGQKFSRVRILQE